jgi:hypothetical protein
MRKPTKRKDIISFLIQKKGFDFACLALEMTDKEIKTFFNKLWENGLKALPNYNNESHIIEPAYCLRCESEVIWYSECNCGKSMAVISEDDWEEEEKIERGLISNIE